MENSNLDSIYGKDIIEIYGINVPTLEQWVLDGLPIYDRNHQRQPLGPSGKPFHWEEPVIRSHNPLISEWMTEKTYRAGTKRVDIHVQDYRFERSEVEEYTRQRGIYRKDITTKESTKDKAECQEQATALKNIHPEWDKQDVLDTICAIKPGCSYGRDQVSKWISELKLGFKTGRPKKRKE